MKPNPVHRLPAPLEAATQRLKLAAREAAERTIESLGLAALACSTAHQRDGLLGAQFELNRKSAVFVLAFNDAYDERVLRDLGARAGEPPPAPSVAGAWSELSLVEDREVEAQISAERFGMEITHACEWELRELEGYVASLLGPRQAQPAADDGSTPAPRNPLRPELIGHALLRALDAVTDRADTRQVLATELGRSLGALLRGTYADIVADLRHAGVQPAGLSVRQVGRRGSGESGRASSFGHSGHGSSTFDESVRGGGMGHSGWASSGHGPPTGRSGFGRPGGMGSGMGGGGMLGHVDPALMTLIRRLAHTDIDTPGWRGSGLGGGPGAPAGGSGWSEAAGPDMFGPLPNLIRAHRDELRQASTGSLDHMVIDVIGSLFDQILSDPKVPPQMARQIARLQLPVLRAALGDPAFFTSRRHPVRRFVNRIASLGAAFEDFSDESAQRLLAKVRALVQEVVDGDFDQIALYEHKLAALEDFVGEQARGELQAQGGAAELLAAKEDQLRLHQLYAQRLDGDLKGLAAPEFVRQFISGVWSQVLLRAAESDGADGQSVRRLRRVGRDLFMSVQPKATPAQRKTFLAELPQLMQELTEGMNLIGWPEPQRRAFFGQLMPAHAEALRAPALRPLDINLMKAQLDGVLERPLPSREEIRVAPRGPLPVLNDVIATSAEPGFNAEEARRIGLVDEAAVDWTAPVDIVVGDDDADAAAAAATPVPGLPAESDAPEPVQGAALADSVQIGFAYQMQLQGQWQKVRLAHVSAGRSFFVFTHGSRHKQTVSLTRRMLLRLCESGRLRAFESAYLLERATARARRQLASLTPTAAAR